MDRRQDSGVQVERARQRISGLQKAGILITEDEVRDACRGKPPAGVEFWDAIVKYPENMLYAVHHALPFFNSVQR